MAALRGPGEPNNGTERGFLGHFPQFDRYEFVLEQWVHNADPG